MKCILSSYAERLLQDMYNRRNQKESKEKVDHQKLECLSKPT